MMWVMTTNGELVNLSHVDWIHVYHYAKCSEITYGMGDSEDILARYATQKEAEEAYRRLAQWISSFAYTFEMPGQGVMKLWSMAQQDE